MVERLRVELSWRKHTWFTAKPRALRVYLSMLVDRLYESHVARTLPRRMTPRGMPALWVHRESNPVPSLKRRVLYLRAMDPIDRAPPFERERGSPLLFTMSKNYRFKRLVGIEPTCSGWQPDAQPMSDSRVSMFRASGQIRTDLVLFTKQVLVQTSIRGVARREGVEPSADGFGDRCPCPWDFRRMSCCGSFRRWTSVREKQKGPGGFRHPTP